MNWITRVITSWNFEFWVMGLGLGGTTGYAINPARDLGQELFINFAQKTKDADWAYSWVPIIAPIVGAVVSGLCYNVLV